MADQTCRQIVCLGLISGLLIPAAEQTEKKADSSDAVFAAPVMGYVFDSGARQIKTMLGIPGAARVASAIELDIAAGRVLMGPDGRYALASTDDAGSLMLIRALDSKAVSSAIEGSMKTFDSAEFSPSGASAILYSSECKCAQVIGGLPDSPLAGRTFDLGSLPAPVSALAIVDDASVAALAVQGSEDGASPGQIYLLDSKAEGSPRLSITSGAKSGTTALAFSPNGKDLAIAAGGSVLLAHDIAGAGDVVSVGPDGDNISSPAAAAFANDGLLIVADRAGMVHVIDLVKNQKQSIACACKPDTVERMKARSTYRLSGTDGGAVWILETPESDPRVLFVPIDPAAEGAQ